VIAWSEPAAVIHNQVRGLHPWPHAVTTLQGARVIVLRTSLAPTEPQPAGRAQPGEVLAISRDGLIIQAGDGRPISLLQLQADGRRALAARDFAAGARIQPGARFGA
jgi:methionyl-tRNA formyltransferase